MQAPRFWFRPGSWPSALLAPLGALYAKATERRLAKGARHSLGVPVVCVGNINAGGTGKTPTVIAIVQALTAQGRTPFVVTRGYGGKLVGPVKLDPAVHGAADVGDEPLLLAAFCPVIVSKDRQAGAEMAAASGADVIVLDDGFQDPSLAHDLSLVVVDARRGFGNGRCIPAGPLREPAATGLARADALITIGDAKAQAAFQPIDSTHRMKARLVPLQTGMDWQGMRAFAFAGIGHPDKFFATLRDLGPDIVHTEALADHQPLTASLMARLSRDAGKLGARLVTTEKDAVRLPSEYRAEVLTVPVRLEFEDEAALTALLAELPR